ncbi:autotransporter domain-containing protein [Enterobacteriaceae bacterium RIT711]|nr:autotransporter domain-containing protein [Enterobacteriaceae bacterium RIT711]
MFLNKIAYFMKKNIVYSPSKISILISSIIMSSGVFAKPSVNIEHIDKGGIYSQKNSYVSESGFISINDGGMFSAESGLFVGQNHTQSNTASAINIVGTGSLLDVTGSVFLGNSSHGYQSDNTVSIKQGGALNINGMLSLARASGDSTNLVIDGTGSSLLLDKINTNSIIYVGDSGKATLDITNGGKLAARQLYISRVSGSKGSVSVEGAKSAIDVNELVVGNNDDGTLSVTDGADVVLDNGNGNLYIANTGASHGIVKVGNGAGAGHLTVKNIKFGQGDGKLEFDFNDPHLVFSANLQGKGTLNKSGKGELVITGENSYFSGITRVENGMLQINDGVSKNKLGGDVFILSNGLLSTSSSSVLGNINNQGKVIFDQDLNESYAQKISGSGELVKDGTGDLVLVGDDSAFNGMTSVKDGMLQVGDAQGNGKLGGNINVASNAELKGNSESLDADIHTDGKTTFIQNSDDNYEHQLTGKGIFIKDGSGTLTFLRDNTLYDGTISIKNGSINVGVNGGHGVLGGSVDINKNASLLGNTNSIQGNVTANGQVIFDQKSDGTFSRAISGTGDLIKEGGERLILLGDNSHFSGNTTISNGTLQISDVNGSGVLGGNVLAQKNSSLTGQGDITGNITIAVGATHLPGGAGNNAQYIHGNYTNYGTLHELGNQQSVTHVIVGGNVDITNSKLDLTLTPDEAFSWSNINDPLLLIDNKGKNSIVGHFNEVNTNLLFLTPFIDYEGGDGNDLTITYTRNDLSFSDFAKTENQKNAASAIDNLSGINPIWQDVATLTSTQQIRSELDKLSGEIHPAVHSVLINNTHYLSDAMNDRLRNIGGDKRSEFNYGEQVASEEMIDESVIWSRGYGSWEETNATSNTAKLNTDSHGVLLGLDIPKPYGRLGVTFGHGISNLNENRNHSSGSIGTYYAGIYGGSKWDNLLLRSGVGISWNSISTTRKPELTHYYDSLSANYKARTGQLYGELGYKVYNTESFTVEPFVNGQYVYEQIDSFSETGKEAALNVRGATAAVPISKIGVRVDKQFNIKNIESNVFGTIGWEHVYGNTSPKSSVSFTGSDTFTVRGVPLSSDTALVEAGVSTHIKDHIDATLSYKSQLANDSKEHNIWANISMHF